MENYKKVYSSVTLSEEEKIESNYYVCYERTQYHYFKRNNGVDKFAWLFADRIFGFEYSGGNEPILPLENGFYKMINSIQEHYNIYPNELKKIMIDKFKKGYVAFSLLRVTRPDGSTFNTSTLYEGMNENTVYYTQTSWIDLETCLPIQFEVLLEHIPLDSSGKIDIWFINVPDDLFLNLKKSGTNLFNEIMINKYGYSIKKDEIIGVDEKVLTIRNEGLVKLVELLSTPNKLIQDGKISKRNQLRMHKHISNKMCPTLFAWKDIVLNSECKEVISEELETALNSQIIKCESILEELFKWTSIVNSRVDEKYLCRYLDVLRKLQVEYSTFQEFAIKAMKKLLFYCQNKEH